jgi:hypothetical protein
MKKLFNINQVVKGIHAGHFVVQNYEVINGKEFVIVKSYCPITKKIKRASQAYEESLLEEDLENEQKRNTISFKG